MVLAGHMLDVGHSGEYNRGMSSPATASPGHVTPQPPRSPQPGRIPPPGRGHPNLTVVIPNSRGEVPSSADQMVSLYYVIFTIEFSRLQAMLCW